ncbi:MAG: amidinotransferase [Actinobacteria bacterium]|nr:amidinotransferase [Actinomycetota bacterium]
MSSQPAAASSTVTAPPSGQRRYLMCPPTYFQVCYRINPWMHPDEPVDPARAGAQWRRVYDQLLALGHHIDLVPAEPGLPDMVFAANGGIVIDDRALIPRFRHEQRRPESTHYAAAIAESGVRDVRQAEHVNEGEGDFRLVGECILAGTGPRSDPGAPAEVAEYFGRTTVPLTLVDPRLYHLDTALAVLDAETVAYWPPAFDDASRRQLRDLYPDAIIASEPDATALTLNLISDGTTVIVNSDQTRLARSIAERGYAVISAPTDELLKGGGGAKCCVLEHHRTRPPA